MSNVIPGPPYPGVYRHYKGGHYIVHRIIFDSSNTKAHRLTGTIMVLYESLEHKTLTVRDIVEFEQLVHPDGEPSIKYHLPDTICGYCVPRFELLDLTT